MALPVIMRPDVPAGEELHFQHHVCPPSYRGGPFDDQQHEINRLRAAGYQNVPDIVHLERDLMRNYYLALPPRLASTLGESSLRMWVIADESDLVNGIQYPSKLIRTKQRDIVHCKVGSHFNRHNIHWHGIEPSTANDGVGKHSFEITGSFVYQFATNTPGTFFYHCHVQTTLHFKMGLYGGFIVDPPHPDDPSARGAPGFPPYVTGGPGYTATVDSTLPGFRADGPIPVVPYDVEAVWVADELDSKWILELATDHSPFTMNCDGRMRPQSFSRGGFLHDFRPDIFTMTGVVSEPSLADPTQSDPVTDPRVMITARAGQTILLRCISASYIVQEFSFALPARVIAQDGHPLGREPYDAYSFPYDLPAGRPMSLTSARRWDLIFTPKVPGLYPASVRYIHPVNGRRLYTLNTFINVTA
jgi:FtsP/CotA-like multicopper oxidase with cupredoxin domain